jgi:glutathione S-transferase
MLMHIIEDNRTPNSRRVRIFLAEKGVTVPVEQIDIMQGAHRTPDFVRLNPKAAVPVLVLDDGEVLTESVAICRYFERLYPEPALMGVGPLGEARVEMWNRRMELGLFYAVVQFVRHGVAAMATLETPQFADWAEANCKRILAELAFLDGELRGRPFIAGEAFTIADITALTAIDFMRAGRLSPPEDLTALGRWRREVSARPSAQA